DPRPRRHRAVARAERRAARAVGVEAPLDTAGLAHRRARPIARRDPPAALAVAGEAARVADPVLLLDLGAPAAVLEVVDPSAAHDLVLEAGEIEPDLRELMDEEG